MEGMESGGAPSRRMEGLVGLCKAFSRSSSILFSLGPEFLPRPPEKSMGSPAKRRGPPRQHNAPTARVTAVILARCKVNTFMAVSNHETQCSVVKSETLLKSQQSGNGLHSSE